MIAHQAGVCFRDLGLPLDLGRSQGNVAHHLSGTIERMKALDRVSKRIGGVPRGPREAAQAMLLISSLRQEGWLRPTKRGAVGAVGEQIPWLTYAAVYWLDRVLRPHHRAFEFGSGSSTIWLAARVKSIVSIEHNSTWERIVRLRLPENATLHLAEAHGDGSEAPENDPYTGALKDADGRFDLVLVDGMARNTCVRLAVDRLTDCGLILLDDADRVAYRPAHEHLQRRGFGRLDFYGPKPGAGYLSTTSAFSRNFDAWLHDLLPPPVSGY
jgi:Methyltransferase domain